VVADDRDDPRPGCRAIAAFRPTLIHSHNLPDALTVLALEVTEGRIPVVHDSHDLQSLRRTPYEDGFDDPEDPAALEKAAVERCAALVAVSPEMLAAIASRHRLPRRTLLFANYALARDVTRYPRPGRRRGPPRVVYQGSLSANGSHYDLRALAGIAAAGIPSTFFERDAPTTRAADRTPGCGCGRWSPRPPRGCWPTTWVGRSTRANAAHPDTAPNKAFEYLASGCRSPPPTSPLRLVPRGVGVVETRRPPAVLADRPGRCGRDAAGGGRFTVEGRIDALLAVRAICATRSRRRDRRPARPARSG
jgi:hypothetical protein